MRTCMIWAAFLLSSSVNPGIFFSTLALSASSGCRSSMSRHGGDVSLEGLGQAWYTLFLVMDPPGWAYIIACGARGNCG